MSQIVTGANIFRAKTTLTAAQIRALGTTSVLVAPAQPGKILMVVAAMARFFAGTEAFNFGLSTPGFLAYGLSHTDPVALAEDLVGWTVGLTLSQSLPSQSTSTDSPLASVLDSAAIDTGIYAVYPNTTDLATGSPTTAVPTAGHAGLLYAPGDTGTLSGAGDGLATYTVLTETGGAVDTLSVAGGTGYAVGTAITTTVTTGIGDGTLEVDITAIRQTGNGTLEIDVLYQPI